jgi:hypothetical protein
MLSLTFHTHVHNRGAGTRGKKCSTGQRRPNYKTKQKRKKIVLQQYKLPEKKWRETQRARLPKEKLEHLPKDPIRGSKV